MRIVIAPDSFKESLSAVEVADIIAQGWQQVFPEAECIKKPVTDGGDGFVDALVMASQGQKVTARVNNPIGVAIDAEWGMSHDQQTAFIEMAAASGLSLLTTDERNPLLTTSFGTGQLIRAALDEGIRHLVLGIGGSATNDGGVGMMQALGASFVDAQGHELPPGGATLSRLDSIDLSGLDPRLQSCRVEVACDVTNPLTGESGAAAVYGPQKGATPAMVRALDRGLVHYAGVIERQLGQVVDTRPGAGAAGGVGAALMAFLEARLSPGIELVIEALDLAPEIARCDLVITGEGCLDAQSLNGKVPVGIARLAKRYGKPVIALAGSVKATDQQLHEVGIDTAFGTVQAVMTLDVALAQAAHHLEQTTVQVARLVHISGKQITGEQA
ncbi:glycerate kinase [Vibrio gazogenes]|uniref:Glycerate 2-kinase n=1 Tax=Vibrio gazogenes DSM 21264 = NBRC 103151 TaxID=1123492 RepID=A0A1M4U1G8_VIBGA|nr:glycerate kinase [Vibrio gazogenes]USP16212.1 glycerate kinase [Vibrio gazogenes]SHE50456.1 glycerate 2-kinase [Vibrio gazogenes DSM 21264] [Vibrio gazogenes DSM 21264 = NBRC 103151]SJN53124.1 Glycerate 2-kinase [Vibrio gazogenes]